MPGRRGSTVAVAAAAAVVAVIVVAVVAVVLLKDDAGTSSKPAAESRIGPEGGTYASGPVRVVVPPGALDGSTTVRIRRLGNGPLLRDAEPLTPVYDVSLSRKPRAKVSVTFDLPPGVPRDAALAVAHSTGPSDAGLPELLPVTRSGDRLTVRTKTFSPLNPLDVTKQIGDAASEAARVTGDWLAEVQKKIVSGVGKVLGYRGSAPTCDIESSKLESEVDDRSSDPVIFARVCAPFSADELNLANNRALMWEFPVPDDVAVERAKGRGFSETVWDEINKGYESGWAILPAAGTVTLNGVREGQRVELRRNRFTFATDALLYVLTLPVSGAKTAALKSAQGGVGFVECVQTSVDRFTGGAGDKLALLRDVFKDCGGLVGKTALAAAALGAPAVLAGLADSFGGGPTTVTVSLKRRAGVSGPLTVNALGTIRIGMTRREVEDVTGVSWTEQGPVCASPAGGPDGVLVEYGPDDRVDAIGLEKDNGLATASGIKVGSSIDELRSAYGAKLKDIAGDGGQAVGQGTDFVFQPEDPPDNAYQLDVWSVDGRVTGLYAVRAGDIRDEFCA
jgi:hypothetical protein